MKNNSSNKIIVIVGTTASGKTKLAVDLAHKFNGEIVSADSRQVYRGLDIGAGKDLDDFKVKLRGKVVEIPYYLMNIVKPNQRFDLAKYQKLAYKTIDDILARGKLPIIVGGTGLYAQAVVDGMSLPVGKPDPKLRKELEKCDAAALYEKLLSVNKKFAAALNNSERNNKRRLIRYLEIVNKKGIGFLPRRNPIPYNTIIIGVTWPKDILHKRIHERLLHRLEREDMVGEVERLHSQGVSWKRLESFGLEYKFISRYLQDKIDYDQMVEKLFIAIKKFAKRQMTWWRRWERQGRKIEWTGDMKKAGRLTSKFLDKKS